jgi:hypothetical protein
MDPIVVPLTTTATPGSGELVASETFPFTFEPCCPELAEKALRLFKTSKNSVSRIANRIFCTKGFRWYEGNEFCFIVLHDLVIEFLCKTIVLTSLYINSVQQ